MRSINIYIFSCIIIALGCIASKNGSDILLIADLIFTLVVSLFIPKKDLLLLFTFLIPPNRILTFDFISAPLIIAIIGFLRFTIRHPVPYKIIIPSIFYLIYSLIVIGFVGGNIFLAIKIIVVAIFLYYAFVNIKEQLSIKIIYFLSAGCVLTTIIALIFNPETLFEGNRMAFSSSGQNVLGIICGLVCVILFLYIARHKRNTIKNSLVFLLVLLVGLLTGSRTFLLELGVGILLCIVSNLSLKRSKSFFFSLLFSVGFTIAVYMLIMNSSILSEFADSSIYRFNKVANNDISNGRFSIWAEYMALFADRPQYLLFGGVNYETAGIDMAAHNMIIEMISGAGIIGMLIIFFIYRAVFYSVKQILKFESTVSIFNISPLVSFLAASMVGHSLLGIPQTLLLYVCLFFMTNKKL